MTLWPALTAPGDALRLRWDTIRAAAEADVAQVRRLLAPDAPPLYRYFAILERATAPLDELWQVVRQSAAPEGYAIDEHIARDGTWTHSNILAEIGRGKATTNTVSYVRRRSTGTSKPSGRAGPSSSTRASPLSPR